LVRVGNDVHLVVGADHSSPIEGVEISVRPAGRDLRIIRFLLSVCRKFRPEVIYERRFSPKLAAAVSLLRGLPFAVEVNGIPGEEAAMQGRAGPTGLGARLGHVSHARMLRRASWVVAVTPGLRTTLISSYGVHPEKALVIPNGVDPEMFRPDDREAARRTLSISDETIICFVGNLVRWQGLDSFLNAMALTPESLSAVVVGDGPERSRLQSLARRLGVDRRVHFKGEVPYPAVPRFLAAANVCVAPFTAERNLRSGVSALKVLEYLASGRPIVVSAIPGARDLVEEFGCGVVVPPGDPAALANALLEVVSNTTFAESAARASQVVRERHSWDRTADTITRLLQKPQGQREPASGGPREPRSQSPYDQTRGKPWERRSGRRPSRFDR
jgi:glycosyltransferase involved in cell wall biosynthesis